MRSHDTFTLLGTVVDHDDSVEEEHIASSFNKTAELWKVLTFQANRRLNLIQSLRIDSTPLTRHVQVQENTRIKLLSCLLSKHLFARSEVR